MTEDSRGATRRPTFGKHTAISVVVANMIGTGVFISLGAQLMSFESGFALLLLWLIGGIAALCGALCYAELGARYPRSGGEYNYLRELVHPSIGFMAGWVSAIVGFAAPAAAVAITFGEYLSSSISGIDSQTAAISILVIVTVMHLVSYRTSGGAQTLLTYVKIVLILAFCGVCLYFGERQPISFTPRLSDASLVVSGGFAVALVFVSYSYAGWNSVNYMSGDWRDGSKTLTLALVTGTLMVTAIYLLLNYTFLAVAPIDALKDQVEIGYIVAEHAIGGTAANMMGMILSLLLISTLSAFTLAGPRVLQRIGQDEPLLGFLSITNRRHIPYVAILFQSGLALIYLLTGSFKTIIVFAGFALGFTSLLAVIAVFVARVKTRDYLDKPSYTIPLFPFTPLLFLGITAWMLVFLVINETMQALVSVGIIVSGVVMYYVVRLLLNVVRHRL